MTKRETQVTTDVVAWILVGAFFGTIAWLIFERNLYVSFLGSFFGKLPLQLIVVFVLSPLSAWAIIWLTRRSGRRITNWFEFFSGASTPSAVQNKIDNPKRRPGVVKAENRRWVLVAIDVAAWTFLLVFVASFVWGLSGWRLTYVGKLPIQVWIVIVDLVPTVFAVVWLVLRNARKLQDIFERL